MQERSDHTAFDGGVALCVLFAAIALSAAASVAAVVVAIGTSRFVDSEPLWKAALVLYAVLLGGSTGFLACCAAVVRRSHNATTGSSSLTHAHVLKKRIEAAVERVVRMHPTDGEPAITQAQSEDRFVISAFRKGLVDQHRVLLAVGVDSRAALTQAVLDGFLAELFHTAAQVRSAAVGAGPSPAYRDPEPRRFPDNYPGDASANVGNCDAKDYARYFTDLVVLSLCRLAAARQAELAVGGWRLGWSEEMLDVAVRKRVIDAFPWAVFTADCLERNRSLVGMLLSLRDLERRCAGGDGAVNPYRLLRRVISGAGMARSPSEEEARLARLFQAIRNASLEPGDGMPPELEWWRGLEGVVFRRRQYGECMRSVARLAVAVSALNRLEGVESLEPNAAASAQH